MKMFIRLFTCLFFLGGSALAQDISPILKFGLFADTQYADCTSENARFYRRALEAGYLHQLFQSAECSVYY